MRNLTISLIGLALLNGCGQKCPDGSKAVDDQCPCEDGGTEYPADFAAGECPNCNDAFDYDAELGFCAQTCDDGETVIEQDTNDECPSLECGDTIETACETDLSSGLSETAEKIGEPGDRDWYKISATAGEYYFFWGARTNNPPPDQGDPDTVCRVYDSAGNLIAENDDMPRRSYDTDCSIMLYASENTDYYVEIMEWTDWDEGTAADGSDDMTYVFLAFSGQYTEFNEDNTAIGTDNDTVADAKIALDDTDPTRVDDERFDWWGNPWGSDEISGLYSFGVIDADGDVDIVGLDMDTEAPAEFEPSVCQFSMYPDIPTELSPRMRLLDIDSNQLASTDDPFHAPEGNFGLENAGITFPLSAAGDVFVEITDTTGKGGAGYWYMFDAFICYPAIFDNGVDQPVTQFTYDIESSSGDPLSATDLDSIREYTSGDFGGTFVGFMDDGSADFDSFKIADNVAAGQKMEIYVEGTKAGSTLDDLIVTLYDNAGASIDSGTGEEVTLSYDVTGGGPFYVSVESAGGNVDTSAYYLGSVFLDVP